MYSLSIINPIDYGFCIHRHAVNRVYPFECADYKVGSTKRHDAGVIDQAFSSVKRPLLRRSYNHVASNNGNCIYTRTHMMALGSRSVLGLHSRTISAVVSIEDT